MKNLHKFLFSGAFLAALCATPGCKGVLDEKPYDFYAPENLYKTQEDAEAAITGVYSEFTDIGNYDYFVKPYWEWLSEDEDHVAGASFALGGVGAGNYQGDYKTERMYKAPYVTILRANSVLERVPAIQMDEVVKKRILGEARFLRAWAYFNLVRLFGPVPLRTEVLKSVADTNIPRAPIADVYQLIVRDLTQAEIDVPYQGDPGAPVVGRANKGAVQALLTKVYLTMGSGSLVGSLTVQGGTDNGFYTYPKDVVKGYEGFNSRNYYTLARDEAAKLIASTKYSLFGNYMDLWQKSNDNRVEHIFMVQTLPGSAIHGMYTSSFFTAPSLGGRGYLYMDDNFYHSFQRRLDTRILDGVTHVWFENNAANPNYQFYPREDSVIYSVVPGSTRLASFNNKALIKKYYYAGKPMPPSNGESLDATNYPLLRYADVLLMFAEAENELNPASQAARDALNQVRRRSNATAPPAFFDLSAMNQLQLRSEIFGERGRELHFEANRRFDLIRWGVYLQAMNKIGTSAQSVNKSRDPKTLLLPLPVNEIASSPAITQNPGY